MNKVQIAFSNMKDKPENKTHRKIEELQFNIYEELEKISLELQFNFEPLLKQLYNNRVESRRALDQS